MCQNNNTVTKILPGDQEFRYQNLISFSLNKHLTEIIKDPSVLLL